MGVVKYYLPINGGGEININMPEVTIKDIEKVVDKGFEKQAVVINNAFQAHTKHFDQKINGVEQGLKAEIIRVEDSLKTDISRVEIKVDRALHTEYVNLEVRVKRIEQKIGLRTISEPV